MLSKEIWRFTQSFFAFSPVLSIPQAGLLKQNETGLRAVHRAPISMGRCGRITLFFAFSGSSIAAREVASPEGAKMDAK